MKKCLFLPVWIHLISIISIPGNDNINLNQIARKNYAASYAHLCLIIRELEKKEILKIEKFNGRSNRLRFTKKGHEMAAIINKLKALIAEG